MIDSLWLHRARHIVSVIREIKKEYSSDMSIADVNELLERFSRDESGWPFFNRPNSESQPVNKTRKSREVNDFQAGLAFAEGIKAVLEENIQDDIDFLDKMIATHPDELFGPKLATVIESTVAPRRVDPALIGHAFTPGDLISENRTTTTTRNAEDDSDDGNANDASSPLRE